MDSDTERFDTKTPIMIVLGMAGSGKTTFIDTFDKFCKGVNKRILKINLDPAVLNTKYKPDIDIRESVNYKQIMKQHNLGPNGAIMSSLSIYCTRISELLHQIREMSADYDYTIIDTPGQIEVFTCSAAGMIISRSLASIAPTFIVYIVDSLKCKNPRTFMSNMLNSLSCMYKTCLPLMLVFNKIDLISDNNHIKWMKDFEAFQEEINTHSSYSGNLAISLSLALEEYYKNLKYAEVSCVTQKGFETLLENIEPLVEEFSRIQSKNIPDNINNNKEKPKESFDTRGEKINFIIKPEI